MLLELGPRRAVGGRSVSNQEDLHLAVGNGFRREKLQRNNPSELGVLRLPDLSHAPGAKLLLDLVVTNRCPDQDGEIVPLSSPDLLAAAES